ncbi:MAG: hypothetical protein WKF31_05120 [Thermoleophilaceae bacterium]
MIAVTMALSACGQDVEPRGIPSRDAQYLVAQLDEAERRVSNRACLDARQGNLVRIERNVANLPDDVNQNVRDALSESVDNLGTLIEEKCRERPKPEPEPTPTETTPTETTPEPTTPDPGPTTTEEKPTETQEKPEPDPDEGRIPLERWRWRWRRERRWRRGNGDGGGERQRRGNGGAGAGGGSNGGAGARDDAGATVIPGADR